MKLTELHLPDPRGIAYPQTIVPFPWIIDAREVLHGRGGDMFLVRDQTPARHRIGYIRTDLEWQLESILPSGGCIPEP